MFFKKKVYIFAKKMSRAKVRIEKIWQIEGIDAVTLAKGHLEWLKSCDEIYGEKNTKRQLSLLMVNYMALVNTIISRCLLNRKGICYLNAAKYRTILSRNFSEMINYLSLKGIISLGFYKVGKHSRSISLLNWNINQEETKNVKVITILDKIEKEKKEITKYEENSFTKQYNDCLSKLELIDKDGAIEYINSSIEKSDSHRYHYYLNSIDSFKNNNSKIYTIDKNNRIYHHLTNLPRVLKPFFNIKIDIDISNSHPLIFSFFLINRYNISINIINNLHILPYTPHYDGKKLWEELKDKGLDVPLKKDLPTDVLYYIYLTQKGKFYDRFSEIFSDLDRDEMKRNVFADVFYTHKRTTHGSAFCKAFRAVFPNVWKLIVELRKEIEKPIELEHIDVGGFSVPIFTDEYYKPTDCLANRMMKLESEIFFRILERCWEQGWCAVNIHDALLLLGCQDNNPPFEAVESLVTSVFNAYGLFPTLHRENGL